MKEITRLVIENEMDIVLAHRRAMQLGKFAGVNIADQTRFATAVAEICRNALEFCKEGTIIYRIQLNKSAPHYIEAAVVDKGPGINNLSTILSRDLQDYSGKGRGIISSRKLVDHFKINTSHRGTEVTLSIKTPVNGPSITNLIIESWANYIKKEPPMSAYEELKIRNTNLLQLTEELRTEKQKTERQLEEIERLNDTLQRTNSYLQEFTYTVSHDLKTPLTTLKLSLDFLRMADENDPITDYVDIISRSASRLEKTVQGLVEILDVQTNARNLCRGINFEEMLEDKKDEFATMLREKGVRITSNFMVESITYLQPYLNSIFTNLLSNSIKYRRADCPLHIDINTRRKGDKVIFTFSDNAEGIDLEKHARRIFTPFTRFNTSQEGKGIGLYIIKQMVEKNGGKIEVESILHKGTTFTLHLKEYNA